MKKNENERKARILTLSRETLRELETGDVRAVAGGDDSSKFCTATCPPTGIS